MTRTEADAELLRLEQAVRASGLPLKAYPRNAMGLVAEEIRTSATYRSEKAIAAAAFAALQRFNRWYVATFRR